jgi:hypothetical protein
MASVMLRYTGTFFRRLRPSYRPKVSASVYESLKALNIFKPYRLNRGGKVKLSSKGSIQTVVRQRQFGIVNNRLANLSNCISINILQSPSRLENNIPNILLTNIRSLRNKVDELQLVVEHNSADIVSLKETWLSDDILTDEISIPGYNFFRSDRQDRLGGGVGIYVKNSIPVKRLFEYETVDRESLWLALRPPRLPRQASLILFAVIYHSTASNSQDDSDCLVHIQNNVDSFVNAHSDALVVNTGDFNPNSTNLT